MSNEKQSCVPPCFREGFRKTVQTTLTSIGVPAQASSSSHTFGHKNHSVFRFLSRTANVFLQKMDALLPEAKQKRWSSELLRFRRHPYFLLVFIFFRGILIKKAAVPGQAAADSDKNHYDDFRDDACKYKVTVS